MPLLNTDSNKKHFIASFVWPALFILVVYTLFRLNTIGTPLERDEGSFAYVATIINDNGLPYQNAYDHKPPLLYYIYSIALLVVPPTPFGIHIFFQSYNFLTLILIFFIAKSLFSNSTHGFFAALVYAIVTSEPIVQGFTASSELIMLLPFCASLFCSIRSRNGNRRSLVLLSGILGGLCVLIKQTGLILLLYVVIELLIRNTENFSFKRQLRHMFIRLSLWTTGFILPFLFFSIFFLLNNAFEDFFFWNIIYNITYSTHAPFPLLMTRIGYSLLSIVKTNLVCVFLIMYGLIHGFWFKKHIAWKLGVFICVSIISLIPGNAYPHYFIQIAPAISILSAYGATIFIQRVKFNKIYAIIILIILMIINPIILFPWYYYSATPNQVSRKIYGSNPFPESVEIAKYLKANTTPQDTIFIFGSEPQIFVYSDRRSCVPCHFIYPLLSNFPKHRHLQEKTWNTLKSTPPKFILVVDIPMSTMYDGKADLFLSRKLNDLLEQKYHLEATMLVDSTSKHTSPKISTSHETRKGETVYIFKKNP